MENYTVCQLQRDMRYEGFLLIRSAEKRKDSKGNDYVDMNLTDRTGEINCKVWNWDPEQETLHPELRCGQHRRRRHLRRLRRRHGEDHFRRGQHAAGY